MVPLPTFMPSLPATMLLENRTASASVSTPCGCESWMTKPPKS
jgi:hypothetical protein